MEQTIHKPMLTRRFGRRAEQYESVTPVQAGMAHELHQYAVRSLGDTKVKRILELGTGSGRLTRQLRENFPDADIVGVDISSDMIRVARQACPDANFIVADAEQFLANCRDEYDLLISNATIQWFQDPIRSLPLCHRALAPRGFAALTTFGPLTFHELRESFDSAYHACGLIARKHTGEFPTKGFWAELLPDAELDEWNVTQTFPSVRDFIRSIQLAGANNSFGSSQAPIRREVLDQMREHYTRNFRSDDGAGVLSTYHVIRIGIPGIARGKAE